MSAMTRLHRSLAGACVAVAVALAPGGLHAQDLSGYILLEGWGEPVGGATVVLLDDELVPVDSVSSDEDGRFRFTRLAAGTYYVQAALEQQFSSLSDPVALDGDSNVEDVLITFTSPLFRRALSCLEDGYESGTGVLVGIAYEADTEMPLPGARVTVQWDRDLRDARGRLDTVADGGGQFVVCGVPAETDVAAWTQAFGRVSSRTEVRVEDGVIARADLPLRLDAVTSLRVVRDAPHGVDTDRSALTGRLLDAATGQPVQAALVKLEGLPGEQVTDERGRFRFESVPPGAYAIEVQHLGYGRQSEALELPGGSDVTVELHLAARALQLEGITVSARAEGGRVAIGGARATQILAGDRLRLMQIRGARIYEALYEIPGLRINYGRPGGSGPLRACVESLRSRNLMDASCNPVEVFVDGVPIAQDEAAHIFQGGLDDYERIEYVPPLAAMRWGMRANEAGALLLWTPRGAARR